MVPLILQNNIALMPVEPGVVLISCYLSVLNYTSNSNSRRLINMEIEIICVRDFSFVAYECFGLWARGKGCIHK